MKTPEITLSGEQVIALGKLAAYAASISAENSKLRAVFEVSEVVEFRLIERETFNRILELRLEEPLNYPAVGLFVHAIQSVIDRETMESSEPAGEDDSDGAITSYGFSEMTDEEIHEKLHHLREIAKGDPQRESHFKMLVKIAEIVLEARRAVREQEAAGVQAEACAMQEGGEA